MKFTEFEDYVQNIIINGWTGESCTISYPNQPFIRPEPSDGNKYGTLSVLPVDGSQRSISPIGERTFRNIGIVLVDFFVPIGNAGTYEINRLCEKMIGLFTNFIPAGGIRFVSPRISRVGPQDDGWFMQSVLIDYSYDEIK